MIDLTYLNTERKKFQVRNELERKKLLHDKILWQFDNIINTLKQRKKERNYINQYIIRKAV